VLSAYGIAMAEAHVWRGRARKALRDGGALGFPVTLRRQSLSDDSCTAPRAGARQLTPKRRAPTRQGCCAASCKAPRGARPHRGFSLRRSDRPPGAQRVMAAVVPDAVFGPVIVFGETPRRRTARERAAALPPLEHGARARPDRRVQHERRAPTRRPPTPRWRACWSASRSSSATATRSPSSSSTRCGPTPTA
jgi:hypothetical protein